MTPTGLSSSDTMRLLFAAATNTIHENPDPVPLKDLATALRIVDLFDLPHEDAWCHETCTTLAHVLVRDVLLPNHHSDRLLHYAIQYLLMTCGRRCSEHNADAVRVLDCFHCALSIILTHVHSVDTWNMLFHGVLTQLMALRWPTRIYEWLLRHALHSEVQTPTPTDLTVVDSGSLGTQRVGAVV